MAQSNLDFPMATGIKIWLVSGVMERIELLEKFESVLSSAIGFVYLANSP